MAFLRSRPELLADATVHIAGIAASIIGTLFLVSYAASIAINSGPTIIATAIYGAAAIIAFTASAIYNLTPWDAIRPTLRRIDHATIYIKIAGTYTPLVVLIGTGFAYSVLGCIWAVALVAALGKLTQRLQPGLTSTLLYLALGWAAVLLLWPMTQTFSLWVVGLTITGGVLYSVGAIFNHKKHWPFSAAIWHSFVLSASACFFAAITLGLMQPA